MPERAKSEGFVSFAEETPTAVKVDEIPSSSTQTAKEALSPPPFNYRMEAGHTPLRAPRPPTPPVLNSGVTDGVEDDTPTRNNTEINAYLTRSNDSDDENELKGPLNMPELPHAPDETNFTFDALARRLEQMQKFPEEDGRPMVFKEKSPGLASPAEPDEEFVSPKTTDE